MHGLGSTLPAGVASLFNVAQRNAEKLKLMVNDLLVVMTRTPEQEGLAMYMTIAAGLTGVGIAVSFFIMLAAANWMLRRPLNRLVNELTGALARDVQRRNKAEDRAVAHHQGRVLVGSRADVQAVLVDPQPGPAAAEAAHGSRFEGRFKVIQ